MKPVDIIIVLVIVAILAIAGWCIHKSRKTGKKCIGCPDSCACSSGNCGGGCTGCNDK